MYSIADPRHDVIETYLEFYNYYITTNYKTNPDDDLNKNWPVTFNILELSIWLERSETVDYNTDYSVENALISIWLQTELIKPLTVSFGWSEEFIFVVKTKPKE